jgi:hypothetical protein
LPCYPLHISEFRSPGDHHRSTCHTVTISGWSICDERTCKTFDAGSVPAGGRVVVVRSRSELCAAWEERTGVCTLADKNGVHGSEFVKIVEVSIPSLNNTTDEVWLRRADSSVVDMMRYDMKELTSGRSIERLGTTQPQGPRGTSATIVRYLDQWTSSRDASGATPGIINEAVRLEQDLRVEPIGVGDTEVTIMITNAGWKRTPTRTMHIGLDADRGSVSRTFDRPLPSLAEGEDHRVTLGLGDLGWPIDDPNGESTDGKVRITVTVDGADDRTRNDSASLIVDLPPDVGAVVINEIMFDPWQGASDYVEIFNASQRAVDMTGWIVEDERGDRGVVVDPTMIDTNGYVVLAHGTILPVMTEGKTTYVSKNVNLNADGDVVALRTSSGFLVDRVPYDVDWHVQGLPSTKGLSLERLGPKLVSAASTTWGTTTHPDGGTPGRPNSIERILTPSGNMHSEPSPFSTDRTHVRHPAIISFKQPFRHAIASLTIHSRDGLVVHRLVDAALIGSEGAVAWDGTDSAGRRVVPGQYIAVLVCVDAVSSSVHRDRCVVVVGE